MSNYLKELSSEFGENLKLNYDLKKKNWFNIGGKTKIYYKAKNLKELIKFLKKTLWKPKILKVFAGKIDYPKYKFFDKYAIRFIMWMTKGPTDLSKSFEFTDWDMVKKFSKELEI